MFPSFVVCCVGTGLCDDLIPGTRAFVCACLCTKIVCVCVCVF